MSEMNISDAKEYDAKVKVIVEHLGNTRKAVSAAGRKCTWRWKDWPDHRNSQEG
jgi:hypothetical protein